MYIAISSGSFQENWIFCITVIVLAPRERDYCLESLLIKVTNVRLGIGMWWHTLSMRAFIYYTIFRKQSLTVFTVIEIRGNAASSVCGNGTLWFIRETRSHLLKINPFDLPFCKIWLHLALFSYIVLLVPIHASRSLDTRPCRRNASTIRDPTWSLEWLSLERNLRDNVRPDFPSRG